MGPWGPFGPFLGQKGLFPDKFPQKSKFTRFLRHFSHQQDMKTSYIFTEMPFKITLGIKMYKKGVQKLQKLKFLTKKVSFSTKNTHKIENNCPRDLKSGLK